MPLETNTELPKDLKLTKEFLEAFKVMHETSKNVFITGNAGTGKSTLLEYFREKTKKTANPPFQPIPSQEERIFSFLPRGNALILLMLWVISGDFAGWGDP